MVPVRIRPVPLTYASVRGGFLSLFPAAYGVRSPAYAPALTSQGSDFLSLFLSPAEAGRMVGVAQRKSGGLQNRVSRGFESRPDLQGRICPIVARSGNLLIYPQLTAGKDRPPGLSHTRRLYGTVVRTYRVSSKAVVRRCDISHVGDLRTS